MGAHDQSNRPVNNINIDLKDPLEKITHIHAAVAEEPELHIKPVKLKIASIVNVSPFAPSHGCQAISPRAAVTGRGNNLCWNHRSKGYSRR